MDGGGSAPPQGEVTDMSARPPKTTGRVTATAAALVRALLALVVVAGLLVGVPWALVRFGHWPITGMPTWRQVRELGSSGISDEAFVGVLTVGLWIGWALLAVSILRELVAQLRGRPRPSFAMGPVQRAIGYLVSSLLLSVGPLTQAAGALPAPPLPVWSSPPPVASAIDFSTLVEAPEAAGPSLATHAVVTPSSGLAEGALTVTVVRGDSPWSLAETHLGDGLRWRELWEANSARVQPDGTTWASPDSPIRPGWELAVPGVAAPAEVPDPVAGDVTVAAGDNFWDLAEGELTEAWGRAPTDAEVVPHWQALVEANRDRLAPPGDPDLIYPGQLFVVPDVPADPLAPPVAEAPPPPAPPAPPAVPAPPATGAPGTPAPPVVGSPATPAPPATEAPATTATTEAPRPTTTATTEAAHPTTTAADPPYTAGTYPPAPRVAQPSPAAQPAAATEPDGNGDLRTAGLVAGGIALAGAVLLVDRRRRAQQRRRRPGRDVMMPPPPLRARERELRAGADVDGARLLDVALRAAAAGCGATGLPLLRWVEVGEGAVMLSLTTALDPPPGFAPVAPDAWVTAGGVNDLEAVADHPAPPLPALVPIGTSPRGTEVLVDLEASGVSTIAGPPDRALGLLRSIVAAATTSPWGDQGRVLMVGAGDEMRNFPTAWVVPEFADGLREAEAYADRIAQALGSLQVPSLAHARGVGCGRRGLAAAGRGVGGRPDDAGRGRRPAGARGPGPGRRRARDGRGPGRRGARPGPADLGGRLAAGRRGRHAAAAPVPRCGRGPGARRPADGRRPARGRRPRRAARGRAHPPPGTARCARRRRRGRADASTTGSWWSRARPPAASTTCWSGSRWWCRCSARCGPSAARRAAAASRWSRAASGRWRRSRTWRCARRRSTGRTSRSACSPRAPTRPRRSTTRSARPGRCSARSCSRRRRAAATSSPRPSSPTTGCSASWSERPTRPRTPPRRPTC